MMNRIVAAAVCICLAALFYGCMDNNRGFSDSKLSETVSEFQTLESSVENSMIFISETVSSETNIPEFETETERYTERTEISSEHYSEPELIFTNEMAETVITEIIFSETTAPVSESISNDFTVSHYAPNIYGYTPKFYQLNTEEQIAYNDVARGIMLLEEEIKIHGHINEENFSKVYNAVMTDIEHQLYAPVRQYTISYTESDGEVYSIKPHYGYNADELLELSSEVRKRSDEIISMISDDMTEVDIIRVIHDQIITNCTYSAETKNASNAYGALVEGMASCEGYSRAMAYICRRAGIACEIVTGLANGVPHMWNMVAADGKWYHIDVSWDDPVLSASIEDYVSYEYFNIDDTQIQKSHTIESDVFLLPLAYASDANYFVYYNLYIDDAENAGTVISDGISDAVSRQQNFAVFRCSNQQIFAEVIETLFNDTWEGFFLLIDEYNSRSETIINKENISIKKDMNSSILRISF